MLGKRLKKLVLVRLFVATLLLYGPRVFPDVSPVIFYGMPVVLCLLSAFYLAWYVIGRRLRQLAILQMGVDVLVETYLIYFTGGAESVFATLYVLTILGAALVLGEKRFVVTLTVFSCFSYLAGSVANFAKGGSGLFFSRDPLYFFYGTTVNIVIFAVVGALSRRLSETVRELQEKLKLSERLSSLGEVVSKVAHEVRNPLSSICTAAEVLKESLKGKLGPQEERMVQIVKGESERLTKTLQRILNYTKQLEPNPKMISFDPLVERVLALARMNALVHSNGIVVEKTYDASKTHIYADEEQMVGALLNLILNAFQAMPQGGRIRISAAEEARGTRVGLEDTGGGISREKIKDIFSPFKTTKKGGTGLGLAEVHKIVTLHEGKIDVESESGKGTTFHLYFPKP